MCSAHDAACHQRKKLVARAAVSRKNGNCNTFPLGMDDLVVTYGNIEVIEAIP